MDFAIPQDYADLLSSFRSFLDREVRPVEERYAQQMQEDVFTDDMREEGLRLRRKSAELGFYAAHMPEEVGGMGLSALGYTLLIEEGANGGITAFLVERDSPGFKVGRNQRTLAGDSNQAELIFEDCRVPKDYV